MSEAEQTQGTTGRLLAGRYRLGEVLGRGGMGTVWRAADEILSRTVAVKELRFSSDVDDDERHRLITRTLREAKAIARIRSNGAVTVYDVVEEDGRPWIVMELVEGASLADVIREEGNLAPRRAAEVGLAVLDVLGAAHREGVLHRDVKPSNVLIAEDGRVVLTDFGIAQVEGDPSVTSTGMLVGAPSYISPERARGQRPGPPADLWSLGGLLYACVEGVPPYDKKSALATLTAVMTEPLEPPRNAGPLKEVIYGLLAKDPGQRLDEAGARALLEDALRAPQEQGPQPPADDATRTAVLPAGPPPGPAAPPEPSAAPERAGVQERMLGALRSVRSAGAASGAAAAASSPAVSPPAAADASSGSGGAAAPAAAAADGRGRWRKPAAFAAAALAAVVLGTLLAFALNDGGEGGKDEDGKAGDGKAASAGPDSGARSGDGSSAPGKEKPSPSAGEGGSAPAEPDPSPDDGGKPGGDGGSGEEDLPKGYRKVGDDRFRFTIALPEGWKRTDIAGTNSGGVYNARPGGIPRVQVDFSPTPREDAKAAWEESERAVSGSMAGYRGLGIEKADYRDYPTVADWSFEREQGGQRVRVLNRGFRVDDDRGYSIMITCPKDEWDGRECRTLRETAFATFRPTD